VWGCGLLNTRSVKQAPSTTASMTRIRAADQRPWCTHYFGASAPQLSIRGDRQSVAGPSPGRRPRGGCGGAVGGPFPVPLQLLTEPRRQRGLDCWISLDLAAGCRARARALTSNRVSLEIGRRGRTRISGRGRIWPVRSHRIDGGQWRIQVDASE